MCVISKLPPRIVLIESRSIKSTRLREVCANTTLVFACSSPAHPSCGGTLFVDWKLFNMISALAFEVCALNCFNLLFDLTNAD
jgi:hypothetical protein